MIRPVGPPDDAAPTAVLCWKPDPYTGVRCDRAKHAKQTPHTWEMLDTLNALATLDRPRPAPRTPRSKGHQP